MKDILFLGDTHGSLSTFFYYCKKFKLKDKIVFHVGDFGAGFYKNCEQLLIDYNNKLNKYDIIMYVIRGNHDNPKYFKGNHIFSHLKLMPDYTTININDRRFLLVGGAISVDRYIRKTDFIRRGNISWWKDEVFILNKRKLTKYKNITDVITHTAPNIVPPFGPLPSFIKAQTIYDPYLISELNIEREKLSEMYEILIKKNKINNWYYGHFHHSEKYKLNEVNFTLLDVNELI